MELSQPSIGITGGTQSFSGAKTFATSLAVTPADGLTVNSVIVPQTLFVSVVLNALSVTTAAFVADTTYQITGVNVVWGVASISGTFSIEKLTGTTAPGGGTGLLTGNIDLSATANTVTAGALTSTTANLQLAAGNRVGIVLGGTLTSLVGCNVTLSLKRI